MPTATTTRADEIRSRMEEIRAGLDTLEQEAAKDPGEEEAEQLGVRSDALLGEFDDLTEELAPLAERITT